MSRVVCIYHKNCFDGIAAAWVTQKRFPNCELRAMNHGDSFPFHEYGNNDRLFIVDFSFPREIMRAIKNQVESLLVLDHHKTAQADCEGLPYCIFNEFESGATLAWDYFFPNHPVPQILKYIKDRDLWTWQLASSREINSYIRSFPITIQTIEQLYQEFELSLNHAHTGGMSIDRFVKAQVDFICNNYLLHQFHEFTVPIVNTPILQSEVGEELCKRNPEFPFALMYFDRERTRVYSLRSIGDFDVSEIAKRFGGGGHKNAAGFQEAL